MKRLLAITLPIYVQMTDLAAARTSKERRAKASEKAKQESQP